MASLDGKVALITGAARDIGKAIAERYAREGAALTGQSVVVSHGRNMH